LAVRKVPPPDFRYVWLAPGPTPAAIAMAVATAGLGSLALALWGGGQRPLSLGLLLVGGGIVTFALASTGERRRAAGVRQAPMAIVPWGVVVDPDGEPRVLRWPAIQRVSVDVTHSMRGGTPAVVASVVTVETGREAFSGRTAGAAGLEGLTVNLDGYAEESARPAALDLDGLEEAGDGATEPVVRELLQRAEALCSSSAGAARLGLPPGGYRAVASRAATPETVAILRAILNDGGSPRQSMRAGKPALDPMRARERALDRGSASIPPATHPDGPDPRPLAAVVAAALDARDLLPDLLRLVSCPHPLVAAVAKASALRMGAPMSRAGALDEVSAFLFEEDYRDLERWAAGDSATDPGASSIGVTA
jgi:hypothetical protein